MQQKKEWVLFLMPLDGQYPPANAIAVYDSYFLAHCDGVISADACESWYAVVPREFCRADLEFESDEPYVKLTKKSLRDSAEAARYVEKELRIPYPTFEEAKVGAEC